MTPFNGVPSGIGMSEIHNWSTKVKLCSHALAVKVQLQSGATSLKQCHPVKQTKKQTN